MHDGLWALHDELRCFIRVEPEWGADAARKLKTFILVYRVGRVGATADRVEHHVSMVLNKAFTEANRAKGGALRAKTRVKSMKQEAEAGGGSADGKGQAKGRGKGKGKSKGKDKGKARGQAGRGGREGGN